MHTESERSDGPFIVLDCTNLNEGIAESTLFGHRKGAFTGAGADQAGLLEQADGGTLFIDEIGELPLSQQPKLLRALENHETRRVGDSTYRKFDARIVAATNCDLRRMVNEGTFRADLYFRLAQMQLDIPPLRERGKADITLLTDLFLDRFGKERGAELSFVTQTYATLVGYHWPGNVRELRNVTRYVALWTQGAQVTTTDLPPLDLGGARSHRQQRPLHQRGGQQRGPPKSKKPCCCRSRTPGRRSTGFTSLVSSLKLATIKARRRGASA